MTTLFDPLKAGDLALANRIVMAPLTRNRSPNAVPRDITATYYAQRASAGLLITEATAISHQGQGYADVPGLYGSDQLDAWKHVTNAVHAEGGKIVVQLWHVGRVSHTELQPDNGKPVAPSAITAKTKTVLIKDDVPTFVETSEPRALRAEELPGIVHSYAAAARNAVQTAGFDVSPELVSMIQAGDLDFTMDQQGWWRGYISVLELVHYIRYGLVQSNYFLTGPQIVDASNADAVAGLAEAGVR